VRTVIAENPDQLLDVGQMRYVFEAQRFFRQQRRDHQGQGGILRSGNRNGSIERVATDDPDAIHALYPSRKAVVSMVRRAGVRRAREILSKESGLRSVIGPIAVSGLVPIVPQQSFWPRISGAVPSRPRLYLAPLKVGTQFFCKPRL